jgi:hypothetical protein
MAEKRTKIVAFQARPTEEKRINDIVAFLDITQSEFLRDIVMKEVEKQEKRK